MSAASDLIEAAEILRHLGAHGTAQKVDSARVEYVRVIEEWHVMQRFLITTLEALRDGIEKRRSAEVKP